MHIYEAVFRDGPFWKIQDAKQAAPVDAHFTARMKAEAAAIQNVMPEDSIISLFGKDEF
jgi:hypothetical protein